MGEKQLTSNEIDDLLSVFKGERPPSGAKELGRLNLDRPNRVPKGIMETVAILHEQAVVGLRAAMKSVLGTDLQIRLRRVDQEHFQTFKEREDDPCCGFVYDFDQLRSPGYLILDYEMAFACLDRLLGGRGQSAGKGRPLSSTEMGVLQDVLSPIVNTHMEVWRRYKPLQAKLRGQINVPRFMREIRRDDAVVVADYLLEGFAEGFGFRFAMPLPGLESLLQYRRDRAAALSEAAKAQRVLMEHHLESVAIGVDVQLGSASLSLAEVLALEEGDVIILDRPVSEPLDLLVGGNALQRGHLRRSGKRLVFQVSGPAQQETKEPPHGR